MSGMSMRTKTVFVRNGFPKNIWFNFAALLCLPWRVKLAEGH